MRRLTTKWIFGCGAFVSPTVVAVIGQKLDHTSFRNDPTYKSLIPVFVCASLALAVLVPSTLLLCWQAPVWKRLIALVVVWCLLLVQLYWIFWTSITP